MDVGSLLRLAVEKGASDVHLCVPGSPIVRIRGQLYPLLEELDLTPEDTKSAFEAMAGERERQDFYANKEVDFGWSLAGVARFRVNAYFQRGTIALAFRLLPFGIPSVEELGLPAICKELVMKPRGLVLVTGPAGSGKSSTLAAMIDYLNERQRKRIVTIEDPIEYLFPNKKCSIVQREVGRDTKSFAEAVRHVLRQDPNVVLIGEMRDLETIPIAITAAETGHLILATLHTTGAAQTVNRIIDVFPPQQQNEIRMQLSLTLEAILSQLLVPKADGEGRVAVFEVLVGTSAIRNLIREGKIHEIPSYIQLGRDKGMQSLDWALSDLVRRGLISEEEALSRAQKPEELRHLLREQKERAPHIHGS